ncbi:MAG: alpha/beta hydrolase [bacterium]|nr:alpha/beta hydrolase [bacterium]
MQKYREITPVTGPEAFEERSRDATLSQAAIVLAAGAGVGGRGEALEADADLELPAMTAIERTRKMPVEQAVSQLDIDVATHVSSPDLHIPSSATTRIAKQLVDKPTANTAAALIEANLHSSSTLVRTAAAAAALDTTGPREDIEQRLVDSCSHRDPLVRDLGRVGIARVDPDHEALRYVVGRPAPLHAKDRSSHTAVLTHGTFASRSRWWRPGGRLHSYLDGLAPKLHMHDPSYQWTGRYSHGARDLAADRLVAWLADQGLQKPDFFAHSHGGTVAHLATKKGAEFDRVVLLSWPVHDEWFPDFNNLNRIIDIRVKWDLVIIADRGSQKFRAPRRHRDKVEAHVNGWFDHGDTNDPAYWDQYGLPAVL